MLIAHANSFPVKNDYNQTKIEPSKYLVANVKSVKDDVYLLVPVIFFLSNII